VLLGVGTGRGDEVDYDIASGVWTTLITSHLIDRVIGNSDLFSYWCKY